MHNNFYFLRILARELNDSMKGFTLVSCFSQSKEELVFEFNNAQRSIFIQANVSAAFSCLSFPESFKRARKNSIDLFPPVILKKVSGVRCFSNERSLSVLLEDDLQVIFKMHGNRANVILCKSGQAIEIFNNKMKADLAISANTLDRTIDWSKSLFLTQQDSLHKIYFTFGKLVWSYLTTQGFDTADPERRWSLIESVRKVLENPSFYIIHHKGNILFSLLPLGTVEQKFSDPITAINTFVAFSMTVDLFAAEKNAALKKIASLSGGPEQFIRKVQLRLEELKNDSHYQRWADLIMTNLEQIKPGLDRITLNDIYNDGRTIEVKLRKDFNGQKNADFYYRKAKNQQIEVRMLRESLARKEQELIHLKNAAELIQRVSDLKSLRKAAADLDLNSEQGQKATTLPYRAFEFNGFQIWVGKNAESNDTLTQKHSYKEDLWLHAKDVSGSHVLIKYQAGKNFPKDVIERAAEIAAFYSKRKNESLCPVAYTPKKFVRKKKGSPAGTVVVERETVILVKPFSGTVS